MEDFIINNRKIMLDKRIYYKEKKTILDYICFAFSMKYREKFNK